MFSCLVTATKTNHVLALWFASSLEASPSQVFVYQAGCLVVVMDPGLAKGSVRVMEIGSAPGKPMTQGGRSGPAPELG